MDMTLSQFQDKLQGEYPAVKQNWDNIQAKWREIDAKLKTLTLSSVVNWIKDKISVAEGQMDNVNVDDWWNKVRTFIVTYYNKVSTQVQQAGEGQPRYH